MCLRWRNLNELMREEYYHQQFGKQRTRSGINDGMENTERADLVDNQIGHYNQDNKIDNTNQNIDNNNQDIDHNNQQDISNNKQDIGNNQHIDDNQYVGDNKQDIGNKKQDFDDNIIDNNQIVIKIAEESNEVPFF